MDVLHPSAGRRTTNTRSHTAAISSESGTWAVASQRGFISPLESADSLSS